MKYIKITIVLLLIGAMFAGISLFGQTDLDIPDESELKPNRSSYNTGSTGTHAFYKLLEENGRKVSRFRERYTALDNTKSKDALLVIIGPFHKVNMTESDYEILRKWIIRGGNALIISRSPHNQFYDNAVKSKESLGTTDWLTPIDRQIDTNSDNYIIQPTRITRKLSDLKFTNLAGRIGYKEYNEAITTSTPPPPPSTSPSPTPSFTPPPVPAPDQSGEYFDHTLTSPVVHIGDKNGAILIDFDLGDGRVMYLSEPFVVANNGLARGGNANLAINIIDDLRYNSSGAPRQILFAEYYHGYSNTPLNVYGYFKGTPIPNIAIQLVILILIIFYTYGKRFARPIPIMVEDRRSPLEFVSSMADLQQAANARELAISNIYPRFKSYLCRRLRLSSNASADVIAGKFMSVYKNHNHSITHVEIVNVLNDCDAVMAGWAIDDGQLIDLTTRMRLIALTL